MDIKNFSLYGEKLFLLKTKLGGYKKLKLNQEQQKINKTLEAQIKEQGKGRIIILKSRQVGITTYATARVMHKALVYRGIKAFVMAHRKSASNNIFNIANRFLINLPDFLQPMTSLSNNNYIKFTKLDSQINFHTAGSTELGRSDTINFFLGSEVAYWPNSSNHLSSILLAVPDSNNTEIILESTSKGPDGLFYKMCLDAYNNNSEYKIIFLPWFMHEEYTDKNLPKFSNQWLSYAKYHSLSKQQLAWAYKKNKLLNADNYNYDEDEGPSKIFLKEFPASMEEAFSFSNNNTLISIQDLQRSSLNKDARSWDEKTQIKLKDSNLEPLIIGVDIAREGKDYTWVIDKQGLFLGFKINEGKKINDLMETVGFLRFILEKYQPDMMNIDIGGGGAGVYDRLRELGFNNINLINFGSKANNSIKFFNKRAEMWAAIKDFISNGGYIIKDHSLINQLSSCNYSYTSSGALKLESKDEIKKRLKCSPDSADAAALCFAFNQPSSFKVNYSNLKNNYNPFNW